MDKPEYGCTMCGRPNSSWDGYTFCGACEEQYRKERAAENEAARKVLEAEAARRNALSEWSHYHIKVDELGGPYLAVITC